MHAHDLPDPFEVEEADHTDAVQPHVENPVVGDQDVAERPVGDEAWSVALVRRHSEVTGTARKAVVVAIDDPPYDLLISVWTDDPDASEGDAVTDSTLNKVVEHHHALAPTAQLDAAQPATRGGELARRRRTLTTDNDDGVVLEPRVLRDQEDARP